MFNGKSNKIKICILNYGESLMYQFLVWCWWQILYSQNDFSSPHLWRDNAI